MGFYGDVNGINGTYSLVNITKAIEHGHLVRGFSHEKYGDFPISFLYVYQRVIVVDNDDHKLMVNKLMVSSGW